MNNVPTKPTDSRPYLKKNKSPYMQIYIPVAGNSTTDATAQCDDDTRSSSPSCTMRVPPCMLVQDLRCGDVMKNAPACPPCTTEILRELDLQAIQHNINLRIDLCYDHDLFFQPISGKKGDAKRIESEKYWLSLASEFRIYYHDLQPSCPQCSQLPESKPVLFSQRLPTMFQTLKDIVEMLVPDAEHEEVANQLNRELLMQQVSHGVLDIVRLSEWLTNLLTAHCAPMRDEAAKNVATQMRLGAEQADMQMIVGGIEKLFGLLELMKLDVANHQIRAFRFPLIDDTVSFQQECFTRAVENKTLDTSRSKRWYSQARVSHDRMCAHQLRDCRHAEYRALIHGLVQLCNPAIKRVPNTLQYDYHRLIRLQEDLQDLVQIELCLQVFEKRAREMYGSISRAAIQSTHQSLKARIISLTEDEQGNGGAIADHLDAISMELTRSLSVLCPQSNNASLASGSHQTIPDSEFEKTDKIVYEYFQAEDDEELITGKFMAILEERAAEYALQFLPLSSLEISNKQRHWTQSRNKSNNGKPYLLADWDDMARRIAHIGALHWKVWAELCYLKDDSMDLINDLTSPVSVYGDERFYGDELRDMLSPTVSSSSSTAFSSPSMSPHPFINSESQQGIAVIQQTTYQQKEGDFSETVLDDFNEDMNKHSFDMEFEMDIGRDTSTHARKGNVRRSSM